MMKMVSHASQHMLMVVANFRLLFRLQIVCARRKAHAPVLSYYYLLPHYQLLLRHLIGQMADDASMRIHLSWLFY